MADNNAILKYRGDVMLAAANKLRFSLGDLNTIILTCGSSLSEIQKSIHAFAKQYGAEYPHDMGLCADIWRALIDSYDSEAWAVFDETEIERRFAK